MTEKMVITKATPEQLAIIDRAAILDNRTRTSFVKHYAYVKALEIIKQMEADS